MAPASRPPDSSVAPAAVTTASPQHALLDSLAEIATTHVNEQLMALATRLAGALLDGSAMPPDAGDIQQRIRAGNLLQSNSYAFFHLASTGFARAVSAE